MTDIRATWASWKRDAKCGCTDPDPAACTAGCEPSPQYTRECPCHYLTNRTPTPAPDPVPPELTAEEARAEVDRLATELYRAQDAVAYVAEMCAIRERQQRASQPGGGEVSTGEVLLWLEGPKCSRMQPSPAARVEVRDPCPYCDDHQLIPRRQMAEHVSRLHSDADEPAPLRRVPRLEGPVVRVAADWLLAGTRDLSIPMAADTCPGFKEGPGDLCVRCGDALRWHRAEHAPAPDGLRDRYAEAVHATSVCEVGQAVRCGGGCTDAADAILAVRDEEMQRLRTETATADQLRADVQQERDRLVARIATLEHVAAGNKRHVQMLIPELERAQATVDRVRAECDRIEAAVRANPQDPDFDGAYLATIGHIRNALDEPSGDTGADLPADTARRCGDVLTHPGHQFMRLHVVFNCPGNTPEPTS